ncbi:Putative lipoprotein [hydrothermal vent metagenome]|uniref:Putative lipoprotein n=1 Tax=hydrothermal vent metagenome TaxID=652676 RepID=A0A1W1BW48_9ZZZZ
MYSKILLLSFIALLFLSGCGSKQYYTPENPIASSSFTSSDEIISFSRDGATMSSGKVLTSTEELKLNLKDGYSFINKRVGSIIVADREGNCRVIRDGKTREAKFAKALIAGTMVGDDALVYILKDNNFGVYDFSKKSIIYNNKAEKVFSIDTRVANPIQIDNLVIIPLLNGKLSILDLKTLKISKEIFVSTESFLNNIIFLKRLKNSLISATPHKVIAYSNKGKREFEREISEVILDNNELFVFSKDGRIFRLDESLTIQDEKKFKFAHFSVATVYKDRVYALDKQGYLIVSNKNFTKHSVYEFPEVEGYSFVSNGKLYYDGNRIDLDTLGYN